MRIVISNQDRISGSDTEFKVQLNLPVDISRKYYDVYIEKVLCSIPQVSGDDTEPLLLDIYSETLTPSSNIFSSASPSLLTSISQTSSDALTDHYMASKQNSIPDFQATNISSVQHFKICIDEFVSPEYTAAEILDEANPPVPADPPVLTTRGYFTNSDYNFPDGGVLFKIILNFVEFEK